MATKKKEPRRKKEDIRLSVLSIAHYNGNQSVSIIESPRVAAPAQKA